MSDIPVESEIIWRVEGAAGLIELNRPAALNALTLNMVREINVALDAFAADEGVQHVVLTGAGSKAFCAGGDIRRLYEQGKAGDHEGQLTFWREEYRLNIRIKHYPKPFVSLIDGIVMGGGVGLSQHGTLRVIGEKYLFAMPEVGIGFFPDVGATYFLPRLKDDFGIFLGLTGARVKAGDALACGLADHFVPSKHFMALKQRLIAGQHYRQAVADEAVAPPAPDLFAQWPVLRECFQPAPAVTIFARLAALAPRFAEVQRVLDDLQTKSPFSLALTARQLQEGVRLKALRADLSADMAVEYRMVSRIIFEPDFYEGIGAVVINRGQTPHWRHSSVESVPEWDIDAMFAPLPGHELSEG